MDSMPKLLGFLLMLWITASAKALPDPSKNEVTSSKNIVGVASQIITSALINGQSDASSNYVFSPLGYATILSILAEGSNGQTRKEILQVLEQPDNSEEIRKAFREALTQYTGNDSMLAPQFKTWFYIYRNNSAEEDYRKVLAEDFLVEIKDIDRFDYDFDSPRTADEKINDDEEKKTNSKDVTLFEDLKNSEPKDDMGTIEGFDSLKTAEDAKNQAVMDYDQLNKEEKDKVSKFDKHVDDEQYIDKPEIKNEVEEDQKIEKPHLKKKFPKESDGPEKISLPLKKYMEDSAEIMEAQESRHFADRFGRAQPLHMEGDVTSALSGNSIVGKKGEAAGEPASEMESKMLLFNGLYFRGSFLYPFMELRADENKVFKSSNGDVNVKFMMTHGRFKYAEIPSENLIAVELPYKNEKYSLLIVMPNTEHDLKQFSRKSNYNTLNEITAQLESTLLDLSVPKFRFECTSRAEKALGKLGLTTLFTSKADLSGISRSANSFQIQELVQHVAIRVDEGSSTENSLSAGNIYSRNNEKKSEVNIDRPFLFYVRDTSIILTAGKIVEIPVEAEIPISFN